MAGCGVVVLLMSESAGICAGGTSAEEASGGIVNDCGMADGGAAGGMPRAATIAQCQSLAPVKLPPSGPRKTVVLSGAPLPFR